jgi:sulfotransferase
MEKLFFQSSLPRSGSTLLQNIMGQNPDFYTTPTSGIIELLYAAKERYTNASEFKTQDKKAMEQAFLSFCGGGIHNYFESLTDKKYVIDKSRGWLGFQGFLNSIHPNPKIICMVRDPRAIFTSFEKKFRANPLSQVHTATINKGYNTTEKRIDHWIQDPPIGLTLERLYQALKENYTSKMLILRFEDLTFNPQKEIEKVYNYLELPQFKHDFNNVEQVTHEDDTFHGIYGDHQIRQQVKPVKSDYNQILGVDAANWVKNRYQWFYDTFNYS